MSKSTSPDTIEPTLHGFSREELLELAARLECSTAPVAACDQEAASAAKFIRAALDAQQLDKVGLVVTALEKLVEAGHCSLHLDTLSEHDELAPAEHSALLSRLIRGVLSKHPMPSEEMIALIPQFNADTVFGRLMDNHRKSPALAVDSKAFLDARRALHQHINERIKDFGLKMLRHDV